MLPDAEATFMVVCRNGLYCYVDLVASSSLCESVSWYLKLGCNNVDTHSCLLCSHSQAGAATVTLRQARQEELFEQYQFLSMLKEPVCSAYWMLCLYCMLEKIILQMPVWISGG